MILKSIAMFIALLAPAQLTQESRFEKRAVAYAQRISVSQLDDSLAERPFADWLKEIVGQKAEISWEVNDCGEQTGTGADKNRDIPMCVEAVARLSDGRNVYISISVGTVRKGIWGRPGVFFAFIQSGDVYSPDIKRLGDLPKMLNTRPK